MLPAAAVECQVREAQQVNKPMHNSDMSVSMGTHCCMLQVGRTVTRAIKEALGHSQTKGWCLTGTAFMSVLLPPLLAAALLPILGNWLASCVYVYGYWIEAALLGTAYWQWTGMQPR